MKEYEEIHRTLAAHAWCRFPDDPVSAADYFKESLQCMGIKHCPTAAKKFTSKWGPWWKKHRNLKGSGSNSGRHRLISDDYLERFLKAVTEWKKAGQDGPYLSLKAALNANPQLKAELKATGACQETQRSNLQRYCPRLVYKNLWVKQKLTDSHKQQRYDAASTKLYETMEDPKLLEKVVWIDAKTMYMMIKSRKGWVMLGDVGVFETKHPASEKNPITLKYYIAVNSSARSS